MWSTGSLSFVAACGAILAGCSAPVVGPAPPSGEAVAFGGGSGGPADACFVCHGLKGEGDKLAPRLAGQSAGYLIKQLEDYAHRWRDHEDMSAIAKRLDDGERIAVAAYYSGIGNASARLLHRIANGSRLYLEGDPRRGIQPCARCHGEAGQGTGPAYPALSAQPAEYLATQLHAFKQSRRRNDPENVMGAIARKLTPTEIEAVADYMAGPS
jgi:cytochrome c553